MLSTIDPVLNKFILIPVCLFYPVKLNDYEVRIIKYYLGIKIQYVISYFQIHILEEKTKM